MISKIQKAVAAYFEISVDDMLSKRRNRRIVWPRHVAIYFSRYLLSSSYNDIAEAFGYSDHTTPLYAYRRVARDIYKGGGFYKLRDAIVKELKE